MARKKKKKAKRSKRRKTTSCVGRPIKDATITDQVEKIEKTKRRLANQQAQLEYYRALHKHKVACAKKREEGD